MKSAIILKFFPAYIGFICLLVSCEEKKQAFTLAVQETRLLGQISSGSGIVLYKDSVWIMSDNTNGYYRMDTAGFRHSFYPFSNGDTPHIRNKNIKEDFESATLIALNGRPHLVAFGSGSVEGPREQALFFPLDSPRFYKQADLAGLYLIIKQQLGISTAQMNIEASFATTDSFYLLNRGSNHLIAMSLGSLMSQLNNKDFKAPAINTRAFSLPLLDSFPVAFSGACYFKEDQFLFTATVEKTRNWVADGEVGASYIGMAKLDGTLVFLLPLKDNKGTLIKQKLESIGIIKEDPDGNIALFAISDNDNGQSSWFRLRLEVVH
ncbi:MAG: hypothetical protein H7Y86_10015 [Rhizobacter sp.]|nr:hypothetical protein [Ferruginibacter sp.]